MGNSRPRQQNGYTYFGVLFAVTLIGLSLAGAAAVWKIQQQREKERELLFIGQQYMAAIGSYYKAAPGAVSKYPRSIEELLRDTRYLTVKRHLRKPWRDPLTGAQQWGFVITKQGGIAGIYSRSTGTPLKQSGFGAMESLLADKASYQEWRFVYVPSTDESTNEYADTGGSGQGEEANPAQESQDGTEENEEVNEDEPISGKANIAP